MGSRENKYRKISWKEVVDTSTLDDKKIPEEKFTIITGIDAQNQPILKQLTEKQFVEHELLAIENTGVGQEVFKDLLLINAKKQKTLVTTNQDSDTEAFRTSFNINWEQQIKAIAPLHSIIQHELEHIAKISLGKESRIEKMRLNYEQEKQKAIKDLKKNTNQHF